MKKYTANYSKTNHNFVVQGLPESRIDNEYLPAICILKNIIQRGRPTLMSKYLQQNIGEIHLEEDFNDHFGLIDFSNKPKWHGTIKGDDGNNFNPARTFFEHCISEDLSEYEFLTRLIVPEFPINEITQYSDEKFDHQFVDFFLSCVGLVIEIDGQQHIDSQNRLTDEIRDTHLAKHNIKTVRIPVSDLKDRSATYFERIDQIRKHLDLYAGTLSFYQKFYKEFGDFSQKEIKTKLLPTAVIRFQIVFLLLLEHNVLSLVDKCWELCIKNNDIEGYELLAIEDICIWLEYIFKIQKLDFIRPKISIRHEAILNKLSNKEVLIDFSLLKRWTDEDEFRRDIIFVRTDYHDMYWDVNNMKRSQVNYFRVSTSKIVNYHLSVTENNDDKANLAFFLENIFGYNDFNEGQYPILQNALAYKDTIGLLPTGGGKSLTYQLACLLQPAIAFVVCPIKALMHDQKDDLERATIQHVETITSDIVGAAREDILERYGKGRFFFVFISPERFQTTDFRNRLLAIHKHHRFSYAVIDEVHCISEWGHDFRTSYLNLANTIKTHCGDIRFLGLTATASVHVLKDIQIEFGILQENVKTLIDYTRPELQFEVINDRNNKYRAIVQLLRDKDKTEDIFKVNGDKTKCGLIFTPYVNGKYGCSDLANSLNQLDDFTSRKITVCYYSGSKPKYFSSDTDFDKYKVVVQDQFKSNKFPLLVATKAFGMGINKPNIRYTIHYGIPSSMEALYQEAGRAGRDRQLAKCYVLLSEEHVDLNAIFDPDSTFEQVEKHTTEIGFNGQDVLRQIFLYQNSLDSISNELKLLTKIHTSESSPNQSVTIYAKKFNASKQKVEKAIYRLSNLGIVKDWTVDDFFNGIFTVYYDYFNDESIQGNLLKYIRKYANDFDFDDHQERQRYSKILRDLSISFFERIAKILLQWTYDKFGANRRSSLEHVYENCLKFKDSVQGREDFRKSLEAYFKFTQSTHILQHIAENNNKEPDKWFELLYDQDNNLISRNKLIDLEGNLQRMIESYQNNTGLNLLNTITRILLGRELEKSVKSQLSKSIAEIRGYSYKEYDYINDQLYNLSTLVDGKGKRQIWNILYQTCKTLEEEKGLAIRFGDIKKLLPNFNERLNEVVREFANGIG